MQFDPENPVVQLCAKGMGLEGEGKPQEAAACFHQAWEQARNDVDKCIAAHYVARHQNTVAEKLHWDQLALTAALNSSSDAVNAIYPSLYLNVAQCYESLLDNANARRNYEEGLRYIVHLEDEGYGRMIASGLRNGLNRLGS